MRDDLKTQLLKTIELSGAASEDSIVVRQLINQNLANVTDKSSGLIRIKPNLLEKFSLIISQPAALAALSSLEIRCFSCKKVISYPAWYYKIEFAVNVFHYFVCFSAGSPNKPNMKCRNRR